MSKERTLAIALTTDGGRTRVKTRGVVTQSIQGTGSPM